MVSEFSLETSEGKGKGIETGGDEGGKRRVELTTATSVELLKSERVGLVASEWNTKGCEVEEREEETILERAKRKRNGGG